MNITPTYEEWLHIYLETYHKPPYTPKKIEEARRVYALKQNKRENNAE